MARRIPRDEEVVAAIMKVLAERGHVASQAELQALVEAELRRRHPDYAITGERARVLAVRSGAVEVTIRARDGGDTPRMRACPVCRSGLERVSNRTLTGGATNVGYRCTWCPWWTGRTLRVPRQYGFTSLFERRDHQLTFRDPLTLAERHSGGAPQARE